ncbi:MAG: threonine dehydratase [Actinomycetota bacterium]|nr:threonine dehydratase [Actinomycetota bacterium]
MGELISAAEVADAAVRLRGIIRPTPVAGADSISKVAGRTVFFKPEQLQRAGSFKIRGAYNRISRLPAGVEVVAASAGNHAQGVALAASLTGHGATIFMPATAPLPKVQATRDYGAEIRLVDGVVDDCIAAALGHAAATGAVCVPPFDDPLIIAGQGTVGVELLDEAPEVSVVVVPVGGGGLISGVAVAMKAARPGITIIGVEAAGAASVRRSLDAGALVQLDTISTMADGIALKAASELTLAHIGALVDDVVTVSEEEISRAVVLLIERAKAVVEPAGAVGLAALLAGRIPGSGPAVAILSGGNVDPLLLTKLIDHGLSAAGRYLVLRVVLGDRPGALAGLTSAVATMALNVLSVEHHREGLDLAVDEVEVVLTLETRDPAHRDEVVRDLRAAGYRVDLVR